MKIESKASGENNTNKKIFYEKLALIRNHGEILIKSNKKEKLSNIIGYNFRLGELECAIGIEQLKKLKIMDLRHILIPLKNQNLIQCHYYSFMNKNSLKTGHSSMNDTYR